MFLSPIKTHTHTHTHSTEGFRLHSFRCYQILSSGIRIKQMRKAPGRGRREIWKGKDRKRKRPSAGTNGKENSGTCMEKVHMGYINNPYGIH